MKTYTVHTSMTSTSYTPIRNAFTSAGGGVEVVGFRAALKVAKDRLAEDTDRLEVTISRDGREVRTLTR